MTLPTTIRRPASPSVVDPPPRRRGTPYQRFLFAYPAFIAELQRRRAEWRAELAILRAMNAKQQHAVTRRLLRDRRFHLHFAFEALRKLDQLANATLASVGELAARFNAFAPVRGEHVVTRLIRKGSGMRWVQDFGPRRRMHQAAVADILCALHPPPANQKQFNGGIPTALRAVATAYRDDEMTHGVEVDFVNFYGSITNVEALADILRPLPASIVENVVWDFAMREAFPCNAVVSSGSDPTPSALTGLSLGAATSPIVGERIMARLLAAARQSDTITFADNLFILGRSDEEVSARIHRIKDGIASVDVGCLGLRVGRTQNFDLANPFDFIKHQGDIREDVVRWGPGHQKMAQYQISAADYLTLEQIEAAERRVKHWRRSYPDWEDGDAREAELLAALAVRRYYLNSDRANLADASRAVLFAFWQAGAEMPIGEFMPTEGDQRDELRNRLHDEVMRIYDGSTLRGAA